MAELASIRLAWSYSEGRERERESEREREREREREIFFYLETHLAFLDYVKAFENVKRQTLKYYTVKIFPI